MKKTLALILALSLVLGAMSGIAFAAEVVVTDEAGLLAAVANDGEITLGGNITLSGTVVIPENVTVVLDLKGYAITMEDSIKTTTYAFNNLGNLTIKDTVGGGSVSSRGIYNGYGNGADNVEDAVITILGGTYNALGTDGGAAIFNYGKANINGGSFTSVGGYSLNARENSVMTVESGVTANNGIYASNATLVINGGEIKGNRSGCHVVYSWNSDVTINGGDLYNNNSGNATVMFAGTTKAVINGGTFGIKDGRVPGNGNTWTSCLTDTANSASLVVNGGTFNGGFRVQAGTTSTINGGTFNDSTGSSYNIYGTVVVNGGTFEDATAASFATKYLSEESTTVVNPDGTITAGGKVAKINGTYYPSIDSAINAATSGDVITLSAGTYDAFTVPAGKSGLTFVGETDANGKNLVTIRTLEADINTQTKGIYVQAEKATFKNLDIVSGSELVKWLCSAIGATNNGVGLGHSNLNELVIENCNFKGNGSKFAVWARACDITITNSTIDGYTYGVESYALGADQEINLVGVEMSDVGNAIHTVSSVADSLVTVEDSVISAQQIHSSGEGDMVIKNSVLNNVNVVTYGKLDLEITDSALYDSTFGTYDGNSSIALSKVYVNNVNEVAAAAKADNITFATYYPTYAEFEAKTGLSDVPAITDSITIEFVACPNEEDELVYDINLVASSNEIINRLNSVDLTFAFAQGAWGNNDFEIIASNEEVAINPVDNSKYRYEFHYNGKDGATTDTSNEITIGQVKFTGYGAFSFAVDTTATTNVAHATKLADNIVDTFVPGGVLPDGTQVGTFIVAGITPSVSEIAVPTRALTINVTFPNAVEDNAIAYQDMIVEITGVFDGVNKTVTYNLGEDEIAMGGGKYVVTEDRLVLNNAYTVTVSGAGYRTARYTVTMTEPKTLNFWNNVMDEEKVVEVGKDTSKTKVTFLAGDIVKDNNINIYDLSAVVSYFASESTTANGYAKYDLNRDGVIDSKDVAYVLVSWNN